MSVSRARRTTARWLAVIGIGAAAAALVITTWVQRDTTAGPVILISIDTLRADRLPVYGYAAGQTPAIDRLANDGHVFEQAWTSSPQTLPAHSTIFSGLQPFAHGVRDNIGFTLGPDTPWVPALLQEAAVPSAAFVSSFVLRRQTGFARGFSHFDDQLPPSGPNRTLGEVQPRNGWRRRRPGTSCSSISMNPTSPTHRPWCRRLVIATTAKSRMPMRSWGN